MTAAAQTGENVELLSVNGAGGNGGNGASVMYGASADGRFVLMVSQASDLVANDTNGLLFNIFRRDMQTGTTALASVNSAGTASGNRDSYDPSGYEPTMSDDGQGVAFRSLATNLAPGAANGFDGPSLYAHDFEANTTTLIGKPPNGESRSTPLVSGDGRFVFYRERNGFSDSAGSHARSSGTTF